MVYTQNLGARGSSEHIRHSGTLGVPHEYQVQPCECPALFVPAIGAHLAQCSQTATLLIMRYFQRGMVRATGHVGKKMRALLWLFSLTIFGCHAQDSKLVKNRATTDLSFINNKKTKHVIVMMACRTCAPISNLGYRVVVTLSKAEQEKIKYILPGTWLKLLQDRSTDFSANLILYSLHDKDAFIFSQNNSEELWRKYLKKEDLEFWNSKFIKQEKAAH